jgi:hypothetical protein
MTRMPKTIQPSPLRDGGHDLAPRRRPGLGARLLGWTLLTLSVGLVSCQSMFAL